MTRSKYPAGLAARGRRLWADVAGARPRMGPGERVLLEEACRLSDRLDRLAAASTGESFARFVDKDVDDENVREFRLDVSSALSEARLTATTLRGVMISLGLDAPRMRDELPVTGPGAEPRPAPRVKDPIDVIRERHDLHVVGGSGTEGPAPT